MVCFLKRRAQCLSLQTKDTNDMQIQRWQSVWLLFATLLMVIFCFSPLFFMPAAEPGTQLLYTHDFPVFVTVSGVVALLLFLAIFMYRNTRRQKAMTVISILLIACCCVTEGCIYFGWSTPDSPYEWQGSIFLLLGALIFALLAYRGITKDEKLLKAADRLR